MSDAQEGRLRPVVRYSQLTSARTLLKAGEPIPQDLRPAVDQIVRSAAKRRWLGAFYALLGAAWLINIVVSHGSGLHWVFGVLYVGMAFLTSWEPQRTVAAARRRGLGPTTRYGWPR